MKKNRRHVCEVRIPSGWRNGRGGYGEQTMLVECEDHEQRFISVRFLLVRMYFAIMLVRRMPRSIGLRFVMVCRYGILRYAMVMRTVCIVMVIGSSPVGVGRRHPIRIQRAQNGFLSGCSRSRLMIFTQMDEQSPALPSG